MKQFRFSIRSLVLLLFTGSSLLLTAQSNLYLKLNSQTTQSILISSVKKIVFDNGNMIFNFQNATSNSYPIGSIAAITFNPNTDTKMTSSVVGKFSIYPNPVVNKFYIKDSDDKAISVTIYKLNGSVVSRFAVQNDANGIDISGLQSGLYLAKINNQTFKISKL